MLMTNSNRGFFGNQGDLTLRLMTQSGQFFNSSEIASMSYLQVSGRSDQNWMSYADDIVKLRLFQRSRGCNSKINDLIWPVFKRPRFKQCSPNLQVSGTSSQYWTCYGDDSQTRGFFSNQGNVCNSKINNPIWPDFELVWGFIHVQLICLRKIWSKTDWVMLMTKSDKGFFSSHGDITLRLMIQSGQFFKLSEISSLSTLSTSVKNIWSKTDLVML